MKFLNYTPHPLNIHTPEGSIVNFPVDGDAPRLETSIKNLYTIMSDVDNEDIQIRKKEFLDPVGMPEPQPYTIFIVSALVANHSANAHRTDLVSPGELIRDDNGNVIGCDGLTAGVGMSLESKF